MTAASLQSRVVYTVFANTLRAGISFLTGVVVARGLGPQDYGSYVFLLGSFTAVRQLLDLGTGTAFYTFISQRPRERSFYLTYFAWQALQFALGLTLIGALFPRAWIDVIWLGHSRAVVLTAFIAIFLQQQVWLTVSQIAEGNRLTFRIQTMNIAIAVAHVALVLAALVQNMLTVTALFVLIIAEYLAGFAVASRVVTPGAARSAERRRLRDFIHEYVAYCSPLLLYSTLGFTHTFAETWLLQRFGGAREQAFYAIGLQVASLCLLVTTAMQQIFWKEMAEAEQRSDHARVEYLYRTIPRVTIAVGALLSGLLVPWGREICIVVFGPAYAAAGLVISLMLLHPIHNSLGVLISTAYLATGKVRTLVSVGLVHMIVSVPLTYFLLAPSDAALPGLSLGASGLAAKLVVSQVIVHNITAWWFARERQFSFTWAYQLSAMAVTLALGVCAYLVARAVAGYLRLGTIPELILAVAIYAPLALAVVLVVPAWLGLSREELHQHLYAKMTGYFRDLR